MPRKKKSSVTTSRSANRRSQASAGGTTGQIRVASGSNLEWTCLEIRHTKAAQELIKALSVPLVELLLSGKLNMPADPPEWCQPYPAKEMRVPSTRQLGKVVDEALRKMGRLSKQRRSELVKLLHHYYAQRSRWMRARPEHIKRTGCDKCRHHGPTVPKGCECRCHDAAF